jgi:hypothetical protein
MQETQGLVVRSWVYVELAVLETLRMLPAVLAPRRTARSRATT